MTVSIPQQALAHYHDGALVRSYRISTSARPSSTIEDSLGTPTGLHRVADKIGSDAPSGMIFKGRQPTGQRYHELDDHASQPNLITSRILWLEGLEDGFNRGEGCDTHARYIYIHGTNREDRLGERQSHGCVLMANADILELYGQVEEGSLVWIEDA